MPDVIAQVTLVVGEGEYAPPGTVVTIDDPEEAKALVKSGDALWPGQEPPEVTTGEVPTGEVQPVLDIEEDVIDVAVLPVDFPGRDDLIEAGITTLDAVRAIKDLDAIPGIGQKTEEKILAYLEELGAEG